MRVYDPETTCTNILELAKERGYNASQLAKELGVTPQAVSKWRRGIASPSLDMLVPLSEILEFSFDDIIAFRKADICFDFGAR